MAEHETSTSGIGDFFCELCKLEFSTKEELREHSWTILHHGKLNKVNGRDCVHECSLCENTFQDLLSFTTHLHADAHQDRYHTWKGQQRSDIWQLEKLRSQSPAEIGELSSDRKTSTLARKKSNGNYASYQTRHQYHINARRRHNLKNKNENRNQRQHRKNETPFHFIENPAENSEMRNETHYMNEGMGSQPDRKTLMGAQNFYYDDDYEHAPNYHDFQNWSRPDRQSPHQMPGSRGGYHGYSRPSHERGSMQQRWDHSREESSSTLHLRRNNHHISQTTQEKDLNIPIRSSRGRNDDSSCSLNTSSLFNRSGNKNLSNSFDRPDNASPVVGVSTGTCSAESRRNSEIVKDHNEQVNKEHDFNSQFLPETNRYTAGYRLNHRNTRNPYVWTCDSYNTRKGIQNGPLQTGETLGATNSLSDSTSNAFRDSRRNRTKNPNSSNLEMSLEESRGRNYSHSDDGNGCQGSGNPEDSTKPEVMLNESVPFVKEMKEESTENNCLKSSRSHVGLDKGEDRLVDLNLELGNSQSTRDLAHYAAEVPFRSTRESQSPRKQSSSQLHPSSQHSVTETSSLRKTSPRLRLSSYVTQSHNSDRTSSVVGTSEITQTNNGFNSKKTNLKKKLAPDDEVERLNALIRMKKEPRDPSEKVDASERCEYGKRQEREPSSLQGERDTNEQLRCSFVHVDGLRCEASTTERYCSYHKRFPRNGANFIMSEQKVSSPDQTTRHDLISPSVTVGNFPQENTTRSFDNQLNSQKTSENSEQSFSIPTNTGQHVYSSDGLAKMREPTKSVHRNFDTRDLTSSSVPQQERTNFEAAKAMSVSDFGRKNSTDGHLEMMDLSMSTDYLVLPHSQVVPPTNKEASIPSSTANFANWRKENLSQSKDPIHWNTSRSNIIFPSTTTTNNQAIFSSYGEKPPQTYTSPRIIGHIRELFYCFGAKFKTLFNQR